MSHHDHDALRQEHRDARHSGVLDEIAKALRDLQFGQVLVVVQDGVVVQIDRTERRRLRRPEP